MAMADTTIRKLVRNGEVKIDPFNDSSLQPAGYDLKAAQGIVMKSGEQRLLATIETVELSSNVLGVLHLKSSFAREGLFASLALVDPGFQGQLTVSLLNAGKETLKIESGEPFLQLTLIQLSSFPERSYRGKYQGSVGVVESKRETTVKNSSNYS